MMRKLLTSILLSLLVVSLNFAQAGTGELAAVLEVLEGTVEIQRVNTVNRVTVSVEAVVGVGDTIYTSTSSRARVTYFEDGVSTEILADTVYRIDRFEGDIEGETFNITASVLLGRTAQQLQRILNPASSYDINTPTMTLAARGTAFEIRVEEDGRGAMLVSQGLVEAEAGDNNADVPAGFGVRALIEDEGLSEVVRATTFDQLDSALDGCGISISISTSDDVSLNVRTSPNRDGVLLGYLTADDIMLAYGVNASGSWYRVMFDDDFGWVLASSANVDGGCAGLRVFPDDYTEGSVLMPDATTPDEETNTDDATDTDT